MIPSPAPYRKNTGRSKSEAENFTSGLNYQAVVCVKVKSKSMTLLER